ncbi:MAG: cation:proton antiporter [Acidobacteria bacterium]|nr:cation:proton antiporter [Acidobacteriota bacterium]
MLIPTTFAAAGIPAFLPEVVALIVAGAGIAYLCNRLNLVPIIGFLLAGVVIGPNGLGLVRDLELVNSAAEVGVVLLLFTIGIEFSLEKLARIKRLIFIGGGLQVALATVVTLALLASFGINWRAGIFTGFLIALSSTAIVLKLLADRGETNATHGQISLGLLIFQDLAIIVMVLLLPLLSGSQGSALGIAWALGKAIAIILVVLVFARRLMPKILEQVALTCSPELFLLTVIAICFGTAYLTSLAGVSLSLGAFLAGLLVSESRFSEHALGETMPLQILFSATFFVSVGMLLDLRFLIHNLSLVLATIALVLIVKFVTTGVSVIALGYKLPFAVSSSLMLAQIGEFSFVLERAGREVGLSPAGMEAAGSQTFIATTVVLMILTPFLSQLGAKLSNRLSERKEAKEITRIEAGDSMPSNIPHLEDHVIVAGYGQAARRLVRVLHGSRIPFIITTLSPGGANEAEGEGLPVLRGDSSKLHTLSLAGIERAKMMVIADDEPAMAHRIATVGRNINPTMRIVIRTRYISEIDPLREAGGDLVIAEELESIVQLFAEVLRDYRIPAEEIEAHEEAVRHGGYAALLSETIDEDPVVICNPGEDCFDTRTVIIRPGAQANGKTISDLELEKKYSITIQAVKRDGKELSNANGDLRLKAGDELILAGPSDAFARSAAVFRSTQPTAFVESQAGSVRDEPRLKFDPESLVVLNVPRPHPSCSHLDQTRPVLPSARGCEDCLRIGDVWVHLRICMTCGHVGCCDSSKNKHATGHSHESGHPIIKSLEPREEWAWCYVDKSML